VLRLNESVGMYWRIATPAGDEVDSKRHLFISLSYSFVCRVEEMATAVNINDRLHLGITLQQ
jgi:hypothetical protein